jgi:ketosteroid isomerase-like protein
MKRAGIITGVLSLATVLLFCRCNAQLISNNQSLANAKMAITKSNETYFQAFAKGNPSLFTNHYTYDCWIMPANTPTLCGVAAPADFYQLMYSELGVRNGKLISIDISGNGEEFVTETGFYHFFDAQNTLIEDGKYLVLWKNTAQGWKMFRNSFSPDYKIK